MSNTSATNPDRTAPEFSAIVTSYYEERSIDEFYGKLSEAFEALGRSFEIIMVNDGSQDKTFEKMKAIFDRDEHVTCIMDFFKNSGQLAAWTAAINECSGEVVLLIDSDLQLDPLELPRLVEEYDKGFDLVSGYRVNRKDSLTRIVPSKLANMIMRRVSQTTLRDFGCTFKLYNAKLLRGLELGPNKIFNTPLVIAQLKRYQEIPVTHYPRKHGKSGWTFSKLWQFNMDNVINLSDKPFQIVVVLCFLFAGFLALRILLYYAFPFNILDEVTNGLLLNVLLIALLITTAMLCIVGEFALRTFSLSQDLPQYIVREIHRR